MTDLDKLESVAAVLDHDYMPIRAALVRAAIAELRDYRTHRERRSRCDASQCPNQGAPPMSTATVITHDWLSKHQACKEQYAIFATEWPEGAPLTPANIHRAAELKLDIDWLAKRILPAPAWRAYEEATAPALRAYKEATAPALRAYKEATATALRAYKEATAPAWRAYEEATATAWRAYEEATATALITALALA